MHSWVPKLVTKIAVEMRESLIQTPIKNKISKLQTLDV